MLLEHEISIWENKSEIEKLKQQGDDRLRDNDYDKAAFYYEKLLIYGESAAIYNNIGCCHMKLGMSSSAEEYLEKAAELEPRNPKIKLNIAMLYLLQNREASAEELLLALEKTENDRDIQYYLGDLELRRNNLKRAAEYFINSAKMGNVLDANAALCKIALKMNDFESAKKHIEKIPDKSSSQYLENMAKINYALGDKESALKNAEQLVVKYFGKAEAWALAAKLYRETGNLEKAVTAIEKAAELDDASEEVVFEDAKIKKALGKTREYQTLLARIVENWSKRYKMSS